ncbi:hypothetical protein [Ochrobactrum sp. C6C9]|uniref:hypothetical protein n=1 Tax=Ochrobactrum sp. C6C9 TaxID=2736662 RepID=UPI00353018F9
MAIEQPPRPFETLTGLERELLGYVERLTKASEDLSEQFERLQRQSSALHEQRQTAVEDGMKSLIVSVHALIAHLSASSAASTGGKTLPPDLADSLTALNDAVQTLRGRSEQDES